MRDFTVFLANGKAWTFGDHSYSLEADHILCLPRSTNWVAIHQHAAQVLVDTVSGRRQCTMARAIYSAW